MRSEDSRVRWVWFGASAERAISRSRALSGLREPVCKVQLDCREEEGRPSEEGTESSACRTVDVAGRG